MTDIITLPNIILIAILLRICTTNGYMPPRLVIELLILASAIIGFVALIIIFINQLIGRI